MTVASAQTLRHRLEDHGPAWGGRKMLLNPWCSRSVSYGMSWGISSAGYDIRIREPMTLRPGDFVIASTIERFAMPDDLVGVVHDKSSMARRGLSVFNTVIEPGWEGWLTLELVNQNRPHSWLERCRRSERGVIRLGAGQPIAQVLFHLLDQPTDQPYRGKYQNQPDRPVHARSEENK